MKAAGTSGGRVLTAAILRRRDRIALVSHPGTPRLGEALCSAVTQIAATWNPVAVRASVEAVSEKAVAATGQTVWFNLNCRAGKVRAMADGDKSLFLALTDLALGGTGTEPPAMAEDRPLSRIERSVGNLFMTTLSQCAAPALDLHLSLQHFTYEAAAAADDGMEKSPFLVFRLLVNIFAYSGELRLGLHSGDLESVIAAGNVPADDGAPGWKLGDAIGGCTVEVTVTLPVEHLSVGDIAGFRVGQTFPLQASARSRVSGHCADVPVLTGFLVRSGGHVAMKIA